MCRVRNAVKMKIKGKIRYIDGCIAETVHLINIGKDLETVSSCCGHFKYTKTIFVKVKSSGNYYEFYTGEEIDPGKKKYRTFYLIDKEGFYYNPTIELLYNPIIIGFTEILKKVLL